LKSTQSGYKDPLNTPHFVAALFIFAKLVAVFRRFTDSTGV
jgi:hypothetical protein